MHGLHINLKGTYIPMKEKEIINSLNLKGDLQIEEKGK
jgi:hypothetical protein